MRKAVTGTSFIFNEDGETVVGVYLGYDYCAEHEGGMSGIRRLLCPQPRLPDGGLEDDRITDTREVHWVETTIKAMEVKGILVYQGYESVTPNKARKIVENYMRKPYWDGKDQTPETHPLSAAWDSSSLCVVGWTKTAHQHLADLIRSMRDGNAVIRFGGPDVGNPFGGGGPCLARTDVVPEFWADLDAQIKQAAAQQKADEAEWRSLTEGLYEEVRLLHRVLGTVTWTIGYPYSLPLYDSNADRWTTHLRLNRRPDGSLRVWLNPSHQDLFNYGWFTADDLKAWVEGDGPIWPLLASLPKDADTNKELYKPRDGYSVRSHNNPAHHNLFRPIREDIEKTHRLTQHVRVLDLDLYRKTCEANGWPVVTWGRGDEALKTWITKTKQALEGESHAMPK